MEGIGFSSGQALKFGWKTMKQNIWFFLALFLVSLLIVACPLAGLAYITSNPVSNGTLQSVLIGLSYLVFAILAIGLKLGYIRICIKYGRGETPSWSDLFSRFQAVPSFVVSTIIYLFIVFIGLMLLLFPGYIWMVKFGLFPFFIADQKAGPVQALELSSNRTYGAKWDLFAFFYIAYLVLVIGLFALGIGMIFALPTILVAYGWIFQSLKEQHAVVNPIRYS